MSDKSDTADEDYAYGVADVMESPFGVGLMVSATGGDRSANRHPIDSAEWRDWLRGFEAWECAPKVSIEYCDGESS